MTFALATANPGKVTEMREILAGFGHKTVTRDEFGIDIDITETGETFFENALLKAKAICEITGLPAIADDSGLIADALGGAPGVYTSSYGGEGLDNTGRCAFLLDQMTGMEHRDAKFVCTIVCMYPDGSFIRAEGECRGKISTEPAGSGGFGYDPVFIVEGLNKTMAELSAEEKNEVSHRGKALREFALLL